MSAIDVDEIDLALINALQINSRASWTLIGKVLNISAATAARRWERLTAEGIAWVTAYGGPSMWEHHCLAFVEVDCEARSTTIVAAAVARDPQAASVECTGGGTTLFLTTTTSGIAALSTYVRDRLSMLDGVIATKVHLATRVYTEASRWRLRSLTRQQRGLLQQAIIEPERIGILHEEDRSLLIALGEDGRRGLTGLAHHLGVSETTVRRRLQRMTKSDTVRFRCDVASTYTEWPVLVSYQAVCSPSEVDKVGRVLASVPEVRVCVASLGASNILFTVWLRSAASSVSLETELLRHLPQLTITNRTFTLHSLKRFGRLLDDNGRGVAAVPMDLWHELR